MNKVYPDITDILAAKTERRRVLMALSWEEKVAIIEQMQRLQPRGMWKRVETQNDKEVTEADEQRNGS